MYLSPTQLNRYNFKNMAADMYLMGHIELYISAIIDDFLQDTGLHEWREGEAVLSH